MGTSDFALKIFHSEFNKLVMIISRNVALCCSLESRLTRILQAAIPTQCHTHASPADVFISMRVLSALLMLSRLGPALISWNLPTSPLGWFQRLQKGPKHRPVLEKTPGEWSLNLFLNHAVFI